MKMGLVMSNPKKLDQNLTSGGWYFMGKYSFEFKSTIVQEYLEGEGGLGYLAKIQGVRSKRYTDGSIKS